MFPMDVNMTYVLRDYGQHHFGKYIADKASRIGCFNMVHEKLGRLTIAIEGLETARLEPLDRPPPLPSSTLMRSRFNKNAIACCGVFQPSPYSVDWGPKSAQSTGTTGATAPTVCAVNKHWLRKNEGPWIRRLSPLSSPVSCTKLLAA